MNTHAQHSYNGVNCKLSLSLKSRLIKSENPPCEEEDILSNAFHSSTEDALTDTAYLMLRSGFVHNSTVLPSYRTLFVPLNVAYEGCVRTSEVFADL